MKKRRLEQEYIYQVEDKMSDVEVVQGKDGTVLGLREAPDLEPMFPSTEELFDFVNDPAKYKQIRTLQAECMQKADEKVAVARQALELIDAKVQRLDHDLSAMETLLQATGEFQSGVTAKPNDMAACQVTPGAEWILAKVLQHDMSSGMYKLADEDIESNKSTCLFDIHYAMEIPGCSLVLGGLLTLPHFLLAQYFTCQNNKSKFCIQSRSSVLEMLFTPCIRIPHHFIR